MKLFFRFLRDQRRFIFLFFVFALLLTGSFFLYRLPLKAVLYPLALCLLIGAVFLAVDFLKTKKRHDALMTALATIPDLADVAQLPTPDSIAEADDRELIRALIDREARMREKSARDYNAAIDYYTVWAHQIKTPIASMRLTLQSEDSDLARRLRNDLNRIERYADMVMTYLRLHNGGTDYVIRECDLDGVVRSAVRKFSGEFIMKRLKLECAPLNCAVLTDEKWLSFVVEQILSNAVKYTNRGSVAVYMDAPKTLCIRDTGIGIASEDLPRIFENGFTGFNGRADKRASGIGLYLCKRVCDQLGHRIRVESEVGVGTAVFIDMDVREICVE